jgi:hypothetical protein
MIGKWFLFLFLAIAGLFGYWMGKPSQSSEEKGKHHPEKEFPLSERKSFAFVVYAHNQSPWCERTLRSIFEQEYDNYRIIFVDDASADNTFDAAKTFILENNQDQRVILLRNESKLGPVASLYRAAGGLLDKEIAVSLDAKDWLAHSAVLSRLNSAYQNPDVWMARAFSAEYPSYSIQEKGMVSFYVALFKQLRLSDLLRQETFAADPESYLTPLCGLAEGRIRILPEPLLIENATRPIQTAADSFAPSSYPPLTAFPKTLSAKQECDLLLFSFDRPLQLYACLESIYRYMSGFEKVSVIYRVSHDRFEQGYEIVKRSFPQAHFIRQSQDPKRDFKPNVLKSVFGSPAEYILFGVDDIVAKEPVDLKLCMEQMERTGAYGFYLRFGKHIRFCYQSGKEQKVPKSIPLSQDIYAWDILSAEADWGFPNSLDMTLFRKSDLKPAFEKMKFKTPNSLEYIWATEHAPKQALGLYFETSKIVNIPLNIVSRTGNPHMNYSDTEELLAKFNEGLKIDIDPLKGIENPSPHFEWIPEFTPR